MLTIGRDIVDAIVAHAQRDHPLEACGVVSGRQNSDRPTRVTPLTNAAQSKYIYRLDPHEHIRVWSEMHARTEEPIVIYHSHTETAAYPSPRDIEFALEPQAHYVIVSTQDPTTIEVRSFRIKNDCVAEESIRIIEKE